ncbi:Twin-arginine translocation pathway signal sequence domain protein precursor [Flavobacterium sp. SOK18b]|uniref:DUF1501 domain-containing protein n=1 Tax=Flavobacterium sp. SOK18b TaxID=797900 RepID=UPI0015F8045C|nr:DUF1501 domain-containing protein [Flavobacterium sp. SOK18b]MBB1192569.1 Twin-arginine translocation pathway signal sequence domain protein precursor [Flavobacterium sp. SOK18b]
MNRRNFLNLTGTLTAGTLLLPDFLYSFGKQKSIITGEQCVVFIQLNGGNDGLNTFIPYQDMMYYDFRPKIAISKNEIIQSAQGMGFHPALKNFAQMQQSGDLAVIQNVGYPNPVKSHFRSQEIWQTAPTNQEFLNDGWLGRFLDLQCKDHQPTAGINIDTIDNLALKGDEPNSITVKDPNRFLVGNKMEVNSKLATNPQLDFVRKIANSVVEGADEIQNALKKGAPAEVVYPKTGLSKNLEWMARLIKGNLNSKVYYTSLNGFDTHDNQLIIHNNKLTELNDAVFSFYQDLKKAELLENVTIVVFSEFGRRVKDNGKGTDHGTAAPLFVIGGSNKGKIIGNNPNLQDLDGGDLKHEIDFRSVYASLLQQKMEFDPAKIGIRNPELKGLF